MIKSYPPFPIEWAIPLTAHRETFPLDNRLSEMMRVIEAAVSTVYLFDRDKLVS